MGPYTHALEKFVSNDDQILAFLKHLVAKDTDLATAAIDVVSTALKGNSEAWLKGLEQNSSGDVQTAARRNLKKILAKHSEIKLKTAVPDGLVQTSESTSIEVGSDEVKKLIQHLLSEPLFRIPEQSSSAVETAAYHLDIGESRSFELSTM